MTTIEVEKVYISPDRTRGTVVFQLRYFLGDEQVSTSFMVQPFALGPACEHEGRKLWGWDGREPVTLEPSYQCEDSRTGARVHLRFLAGKIELCSDSNVVLREIP